MIMRNHLVPRRRSVDWGWVAAATLFIAVVGALLIALLFVMNRWLAP
jgi:hypothetical protein